MYAEPLTCPVFINNPKMIGILIRLFYRLDSKLGLDY